MHFLVERRELREIREIAVVLTLDESFANPLEHRAHVVERRIEGRQRKIPPRIVGNGSGIVQGVGQRRAWKGQLRRLPRCAGTSAPGTSRDARAPTAVG